MHHTIFYITKCKGKWQSETTIEDLIPYLHIIIVIRGGVIYTYWGFGGIERGAILQSGAKQI